MNAFRCRAESPPEREYTVGQRGNRRRQRQDPVSRLVPTDDRFFGLFLDGVRNVETSAVALEDMVGDLTSRKIKRDAIHELVRDRDRGRRGIGSRLARGCRDGGSRINQRGDRPGDGIGPEDVVDRRHLHVRHVIIRRPSLRRSQAVGGTRGQRGIETVEIVVEGPGGGIRDWRLGIRDSRSGTRDAGLGTRETGLGIRNAQIGFRDCGVGVEDSS